MRDSWDNMFEEVPASFEARMKETLSALEEKPKIRRFRFGTGALVAAALLVAVLGGTALATDFFGLKSLTVTDPNASPAAVSATAEPVSDSTVIALQGVPGSPEFKANAEWMDFLASYDTAAMAKETAACLLEKYDLYSVSTQDMANELDQITRKYNLRLHTSVTDFDSEDTLYSLLNAEPFLTDCTAVSGYIYEDGSFQAYGTNVSGKSYEYQLGRYVKGAFSEVTLNIGSAEDYEEWIYTTSRGDEVQLSLGPSRCVVMSDQPKAFVAINLLGGWLIVRQGGSSGGDDALALVIHKVTGWRLSRAYLFTDLTVLFASLSYIPFRRIAFSLVTVTVSSLLIDFIKEWQPKTNV